MSWDLWVHACDVAGEVLLDEVSNVGKACAASDISILDFMESAHTKDTSLRVHVECLQVVQVHLGRGPCLRRVEQHWHDEGHVQT